MILKPQDVVVALKLLALNGRSWTYQDLAETLAISASEINVGVKRSLQARLLRHSESGGQPKPIRQNLLEFLVHGVKYAFPPDHGEPTRGLPTAYAAPPLRDLIQQTNELPPVWSHPQGSVRGYAFSPLYRSVPFAALRDPTFYELMALVDAIRNGRAREQTLARKELEKRLARP